MSLRTDFPLSVRLYHNGQNREAESGETPFNQIGSLEFIIPEVDYGDRDKISDIELLYCKGQVA